MIRAAGFAARERRFQWWCLGPTLAVLAVVTLLPTVYLIVTSFGLSSLVFLIVLAVVNFLMLGGFIWVISRATIATTRRAQAPAIRARRRAVDSAQLPERAGVIGGGQ